MENLADDCQDWLERCISGEKSHTGDDSPLDLEGDVVTFDKTSEERKGTYARLRSASKPHSTPQTLKWLDDNYEIAVGVCIPRSTLYVHYLDYCEKNDTQPVNAASFGKIIRQQFPQLTTRRLGTRGQSKYHYYGIGVKETSVYYEASFSAKGAQGCMNGKKDNVKQYVEYWEREVRHLRKGRISVTGIGGVCVTQAIEQIIAYSPRSKLGTLLPDFPDVKEIQLPPSVEEGKVFTFLMMYRTHCQRILDTVIRANFDEVQSFLLHFWQGMPTHIKSILESKVLVTLVGVCDSILYKAIANVLMPTVLQPLPESLTQVIRKFSLQLDDWLRQALDSLPQGLQTVKFDLARCFSQVLKRQTSLNHLCQAARTVIHSAEITSQMLDDWINVDLNSIIKQTLYTMDNFADADHNAIVKLTRDFELLLEDQAPLEAYIEWLDNMVDRCVVQKSQREPGNMKRIARQFLLMWSCFGTRIIRDMTLHSAPSFGSYHLLHLMFDEYVLYTVEHLYNQDKGNQLFRAAKGEISLDIVDEILRADPHPGRAGCNAGSHIEDRTSVIRGPECAVPNPTNTKPLSHLEDRFHVTGGYPSIQTFSNYDNMKNNSFQSQNQLSPWHTSVGTNATVQSADKTRFPSGFMHSSVISTPSAPETYNGCNSNAENNYEWYDWTTDGNSNINVTSPVIPNISLMSRNQNVDHRTSSRTNASHDGQYPPNEMTEYTYFHEQQLRRHNLDSQTTKRKLGDELPVLHGRSSMSDFYQHHVSNII